MRHTGKICGVFTAGILGFLIFMAPDTFSGAALFADLTTGSLPAATARADKAQPNPPISRQLAKMKAADDAYFDAATALEDRGENGEDLARLEAADDAYFEAVIALETAADNARRLARIEAADNAYFEAQMKLEAGDETGDMLARLDAADGAYFKAATALEGDIETRRQLTELMASEKTDFETVVAQMEAVDPSFTGSLPPVSGIDDLEDPITKAAFPTPTIKANQLDPVAARPNSMEAADDYNIETAIKLDEDMAADRKSVEGNADATAADPAPQDVATEYPAAGPAPAVAGEKAGMETVRMASSAPAAPAAATPAQKAERMPAPKMNAVAKRRSAKRARSARLEARSEERKPVGPVRMLFRMIARALRPIPQH